MRLPGYGINGISVAIGIAIVDLGLTAIGGPAAGLFASTGAICTSLADLPLAPSRLWRRAGMAALAGCASGLLASALREWGVAMGLVVMGLAFCAAMVLSWGPRAAQLSFIPILALVFTLASPAPHDVDELVVRSAWTALGAASYYAWAVATSHLLQPRYRTLALANALAALGALLRSRAALLGDPSRAPTTASRGRLAAADRSALARQRADADRLAPAGTPPLQEWIRSQVALDERLQAARDLLFPASADARTQPAIGALLQAIEMRDTLLAGELDIELLGHDASARALRRRMHVRLVRVADGVDEMALALRLHGLEATGAALGAVVEADLLVADARDADADAVTLRADDPRYPLVMALRTRARQLVDVLGHMQAALRGQHAPTPFAQEELQLFVSPEGWPLDALRAQLSLDSPIFRHAVRLSIALGSAYFLGLALPWASHPHWLVLSVAVVMRGNLEQTLSRRDDRVLGTMIGCLVVLLLGRFAPPWLAIATFIAAAGTAHSFATARYIVTSAAASVMALMQAHLAQPDAGFGVFERIGDTVLGAALAWAFSYFWPWWERRGVQRLTGRVLKSLRTLCDEILRPPDPDRPDLQVRLARREVYEAVGAIASAAQRTSAEPERVRVPLYALGEMLARCHVLMAQLLSVRLLLLRRRHQLDPDECEAALAAARADVVAVLDPKAAAALPHPGAAADGGEAPVTIHATASNVAPSEDVDHAALPAMLPDSAVMPWLRRRLHLTARAAERVRLAAQALRDAAR
jgi:hypothetical protein